MPDIVPELDLSAVTLDGATEALIFTPLFFFGSLLMLWTCTLLEKTYYIPFYDKIHLVCKKCDCKIGFLKSCQHGDLDSQMILGVSLCMSVGFIMLSLIVVPYLDMIMEQEMEKIRWMNCYELYDWATKANHLTFAYAEKVYKMKNCGVNGGMDYFNSELAKGKTRDELLGYG